MKKLVLIFGAVAMFTLGSFTNSPIWKFDDALIAVKYKDGVQVDYVKGYVTFKLERDELTSYLKINLDSIDFKSSYDMSNGDIWVNN
tara:strand:- start:2716 stop:2976 length:261 start_codon:yes stop_codon:yes gene_type:complete